VLASSHRRGRISGKNVCEERSPSGSEVFFHWLRDRIAVYRHVPPCAIGSLKPVLQALVSPAGVAAAAANSQTVLRQAFLPIERGVLLQMFDAWHVLARCSGELLSTVHTAGVSSPYPLLGFRGNAETIHCYARCLANVRAQVRASSHVACSALSGGSCSVVHYPNPGSSQLPLGVRAKDMKTLFPFSRYSPKGPHSLNPTLPYRVWAAKNAGWQPVSRYRTRYARERATSMM